MASGDTTIVKFAANNTTDAQTQIESLSVVAGDLVITWQQDNQVYVAKIKTE